jgi:hypothetical protein
MRESVFQKMFANALGILTLLALGACCSGPSNFLTIGIGGNTWTTTPNWGGTIELSIADGAKASVSRPLGRELGGEALEFETEGTLEPISVPSSELRVDNRKENGCGESVIITYDLSVLEVGSYRMIHRRENGTSDPLNCLEECPWVLVDGEEMLISIVHIKP